MNSQPARFTTRAGCVIVKRTDQHKTPGGCTVTKTGKKRVWGLLAALALAALLALPAAAAEYAPTLDELDRLQTLAGNFAAENDTDITVTDLTLSATRPYQYDTTLWQLTLGARDPAFENYLNANAPELLALRDVGVLPLPDGQAVDFNHLLATLQLVSKGLPVAGGWGGDLMELIQSYRGQAADVAGYEALLAGQLGVEGSRFGAADLCADLDALAIGAQLQADARLADVLRSYYASATTYDRTYAFIALSFGNVDAGSRDAFRQTVYNTFTGDAGMQLLLYLNGLWQVEGWQLDPELEPLVRAACNVFADWLSAAVNGERVTSSSDVRMVTMAGQSLIDALNTLGDTAAATAAQTVVGTGAPEVEVSGVDGMLNGAADQLRAGFDVELFRAILLVMGAAAAIGLAVNVGMFVAGLRRRD